MPDPLAGGCACGSIRYHITGDPMVMLHCQCRQCQKDSGTGHGSHLVFRNVKVELHGKANTWRQTGDGGTVKQKAFCPTCGSPVYMTFPGSPDIISVMAASLDEPDRFQPQIIVWSDTGQTWDPMEPTLPSFTRMPPPS